MNLLLLILKLFPILLTVISTIEAAAPMPKIGPAKLNLVKAAAVSAYQADGANRSVMSQDQLLALIEALTAQIVGFYNLIGIFKKSS